MGQELTAEDLAGLFELPLPIAEAVFRVSRARAALERENEAKVLGYATLLASRMAEAEMLFGGACIDPDGELEQDVTPRRLRR